MEGKKAVINEHILKLTGGASLSEELNPALRGNIEKAEFDIYEVSKRSRDDGTFDLIYKAKFVSEIEIKQAGKPIRGTDKTSKSKKLRGAIWWLAQEEKAEDYDTFYQVAMDKIIANIPEVWKFVKNL